MLDFLISPDFWIGILGFAFIWAAADLKRNKESEIKILSLDFIIQLSLIAIGVGIIVECNH